MRPGGPVVLGWFLRSTRLPRAPYAVPVINAAPGLSWDSPFSTWLCQVRIVTRAPTKALLINAGRIAQASIRYGCRAQHPNANGVSAMLPHLRKGTRLAPALNEAPVQGSPNNERAP